MTQNNTCYATTLENTKELCSSILKDSPPTPSKYGHISAETWPSEKRTASVCTLPLANKTFTRSSIRVPSLRHATQLRNKTLHLSLFRDVFLLGQY